MENYSMNVGEQGVEQDRSCDIMGFDNVTQYTSKTSTTEPTVPYEKPKMLIVEAVEHSNTTLTPASPTAHDLRRNL